MEKKNNRQWLIAVVAILVGLFLGIFCGAIGGGTIGYIVGRGNIWQQPVQSNQEPGTWWPRGMPCEPGQEPVPVQPQPQLRPTQLPIPDVPGNVRGALIVGVVPGTPAERAGLRAGDIVTAVGGQEVRPGQPLVDLIQQHKPGERVLLEVRRGLGEILRVDVQLVEHPDNPGQAYLGVRVQDVGPVAP